MAFKDLKITCISWIAGFIRFMILPVLLLLIAPFLGLISLGGAIIRAMLIRRAKKKGNFKKSNLRFAFITTVWFFLFAFGIALNIDAPLIENDLTIDDLRSAGPDSAESYKLLESINIEDGVVISEILGFSSEDANRLDRIKKSLKDKKFSEVKQLILTNEDLIQRCWQQALTGRTVIQKLSEYEQIADLTEPNIDFQMDYLSSLRHLLNLYTLHAILQFEKGNYNVAVEELKEIDGIFRKLSVNARTLIMKLVCVGAMSSGIQTANYFANHKDISEETLAILTDIFRAISKDQISLANSWKSEYLLFKEGSLDPEEPLKIFETRFPKTRRFFKKNSTLRLYRNWIQKHSCSDSNSDNRITNKMNVWPCSFLETSEIPLTDNLNLSYLFYNPSGYIALQSLIPAFEVIETLHLKLQIQDDLLQVVFAMRQGKEYDLASRAYGDEYVIDLDAEIIYSHGKDGKVLTDDDIKFYIDPAVLGLR